MNPNERLNESAAPADTRSALLGAARRLFARRGYDGASIRAITRDAGSNLGAVTYHFGSKEGLYHEVLESVLGPLAARVGEVVDSGRESVDRVCDVVRAFFRYLDEHPELPQLMLQEIAAGKPPPPPVRGFLQSVTGSLAHTVAEGQEAGTIRRGDPMLLGLSCVIQPIHMTLIRHWLGLLKGADPTDPDRKPDLVRHAVAFARAGLASTEEKPR